MSMTRKARVEWTHTPESHARRSGHWPCGCGDFVEQPERPTDRYRWDGAWRYTRGGDTYRLVRWHLIHLVRTRSRITWDALADDFECSPQWMRILYKEGPRCSSLDTDEQTLHPQHIAACIPMRSVLHDLFPAEVQS